MERFTHILSCLKSLRILHICFCHSFTNSVLDIGRLDEGLAIFWENFAGAMPPCLEELVVLGDPLVTREFVSISAVFGHLCSLRVLKLEGLGIGCDWVRKLSQTFRCDACQGSQIESINLNHNNIEWPGAYSLLQALDSGHLGSLKALDLSYNNLGEPKSSALRNPSALDSAESILDEGIASLGMFFQSDHATELESLDLSDTGIGDRDISDLAEALKLGKLPKLRTLLLKYNAIGNKGLAALVEAFKSGNMKDLETVNMAFQWKMVSESEVSSSKQTEDAVVELAGVLEHNKLASLQDMDFSGLQLFSVDAQDAMKNAFRRNPNLIASVKGLGRVSEIAIARAIANRNRRNMMIQLAGKYVLARHGKVFFCGDPGVGKTMLKTTFCNETSSDQQGQTRGIEVTDFPGKETGVTLALWDLAGQHDFEVLHSAFLPDLNFAGGQATFFVIVCDARYFTKGKQELKYWMRFISSNSVKDIQVNRRRRVFVVLNCFYGHAVPECELQRWKGFLEQCAGDKGFKAYLNVHKNPFVADVKEKTAIQKFKRKIFYETRKMLQERQMPQICNLIQQEGIEWVKENWNYPVLKWDEFERMFGADGLVDREKLEAATEYLHEAGYVILFKTAAPTSTSFDREGETLDFEGGLVIMKPQWFCKQVVGNLLLPADILDRLSDMLDFESEREGVVQIVTLAKDEFRVPQCKIHEVVRMMCRIGICYQLPGRSDIIFVPALMENSDMPGWSQLSWNGVTDPGAWVTGFSLVVKNHRATLLPIDVLAQLQVNTALDKYIGQKPDCDFIARKNSVSFKFQGMHVLIEYSSHKQERMDVLVKPFVRNFSRKDQINVAQEFISRMSMIVDSCARGVVLEKRIVRPWSVAAGYVEMAERSINIQVDTLVKEVEDRGYLKTLELDVNGDLVGEDDVLSDQDLSCFLRTQGPSSQELGGEGAIFLRIRNPDDEEGSSSIPMTSKPDLGMELLHSIQDRLHELNNNVNKGFAESRGQFIDANVSLTRIGESQQHIQETEQTFSAGIGKLNQHMQKSEARIVESAQCVRHEGKRISAEIRFSKHLRAANIMELKRSFRQSIENSERRISAQVVESNHHVQEGEGRIRADIAELKRSSRLQNEDTVRFWLEDRDTSIPRYMYPGRKAVESTSVWYEYLLEYLTSSVAKSLVLRFLCEASYANGNVHEVTTQEGIGMSEMKDWAKTLLPMVVGILKVVGIAGNIAGNFGFPVMDLLLGVDEKHSRICGNIAQLAEGMEGAAEFLELQSEALASVVPGQDSHPTNFHAASLAGDTVEQLKGDAIKILSRVRRTMEEEGTWSHKVGLQRVRLDWNGRKRLVWICRRCHECYKRDRADCIQDAPV